MISICANRRAISASSLVTIVFGCLLGAPAMAAPIIVQYTFPIGNFAPTTTALNVTSAAVNDTGSSADLAQGVAFPNTVYLQQLVLSTTAATAVSNNQFFQFTIGANAGYQLDLSDLTFDAARSGPTTPRGWVLRSSIDGFRRRYRRRRCSYRTANGVGIFSKPYRRSVSGAVVSRNIPHLRLRAFRTWRRYVTTTT